MHETDQGKGFADPEHSSVVTFLRHQRGLVDRLLTEHIDDGSGRCQVCSSAGTRPAWPCTIHRYAELAATTDGRDVNRR